MPYELLNPVKAELQIFIPLAAGGSNFLKSSPQHNGMLFSRSSTEGHTSCHGAYHLSSFPWFTVKAAATVPYTLTLVEMPACRTKSESSVISVEAGIDMIVSPF